jgi:hypothetical protein
MKQLIAYSLYGSEERYTIGAIKNAILATRHFKGYTLRFYTGDSVPESIKQTLRLFPHVQIEEQWDQPEDHRAKLWRFQALADQRYDVVLSRDSDARLTHRERIAHEEFLASGLDFHIMKDHPTGHNYQISAGMFAARTKAIPADLDETEEPGNYYTTDQDWLAAYIWPLIKDSALIHDEHYETPTEGQSKRRPFPIGKKATLHHIGAALEADDRFVFSIDQALAKIESGSDKYLAEWLV